MTLKRASVAVGIGLVVIDVVFWISAAMTSGDAQKAWIAAGATVLGAGVAVVGTSLGAYLAAVLAFGSAQQADRRATYARLMGAVAAYNAGQQKYQRLLADYKQKNDTYKNLFNTDPGSAATQASADKATAAATQSSAAAARLLNLEVEVYIAAAAARLMGPPEAAQAAEDLQKAVHDDPWPDGVPARVKDQVEKTFDVLSKQIQSPTWPW
ncbi:hypothetical protein [Nocardia alni]|uniref:hypothetical protein n=1 Tax=Nocardia alni TaxID=2815723 RepID=UPI001C2142B9|nr:hypothetical protein [Nocardia alni]